MAEQKRKTQAEKAASASKNKKGSVNKSGTTNKTSGKKSASKNETPQNENRIPGPYKYCKRQKYVR